MNFTLHSRKRQAGFGLLELSITALIATIVGIGILRKQVADFENEFAQQVAAEIYTIHDAARTFYARTNSWPDQANNCAGALQTLRDNDLLIGFNVSRWGGAFTTQCFGGVPPALFQASAIAPAERFARVAASRLVGAEVDAATFEVSSTIPPPGAAPGANNDQFLHRVPVPGRPELNSMTTTLTMGEIGVPDDGSDIDMNGNDVININQLTAGGAGAITFPDDSIFLGGADFAQGLDWGDSSLSVAGGRGLIDLGIRGAGPGQINFFNGGLSGSLLAGAGRLEVDTSLRIDNDTDVGGDLDVGGNTDLDGTLIVDGLSTFNDDMQVNADITATGRISGLDGFFDSDVFLCQDDNDECALRVGDGISGRSLALGYDGAVTKLWQGGNAANSMDAFVVLANTVVFDGDVASNVIATGNMQAAGVVSGSDVQTLAGDSLIRAVQDVAIVPNLANISKPVCGAVAPNPRIYLAVSQAASGNPAPPIHQVVTYAIDNGATWQARMEILTEDGVITPDPLYGQILAVIKCEV